MNRELRVLVTPRDVVPYQTLLYQDFEAKGVRIRYAEGPTPSQTLNIILSPLVLAWWRLRGYRILHIHWLFKFSFPWARNAQLAGVLAERFFALYLWSAQYLGYSIVWTAHDLLPHRRVFADDERARKILLTRTTAVIALSEATAAELRALGGKHVVVIPSGAYTNFYPITCTKQEARGGFDFKDDDVVLGLIGRIEYYKGADRLLEAASLLPKDSRISILLAGLCSDTSYRDQLITLANCAERRVVTKFEWISDSDLPRFFQAIDVAVFPFRSISNSGSVLLAQSFARPVVIPNLPALQDIPEDSVIRFEPNLESLVVAMQQAELMTEDQYRDMSQAALVWSESNDWERIAFETIGIYRTALGKTS